VSSTFGTGCAGACRTPSGGDDETAVRTDGDEREVAVATHCIDRGVERGDLVEASQLVLVSEEDVDLVRDERPEVVAVPVDAERVAERQRDLARVLVRDPRRVPDAAFASSRSKQVPSM
jgi:hypothetical protein